MSNKKTPWLVALLRDLLPHALWGGIRHGAKLALDLGILGALTVAGAFLRHHPVGLLVLVGCSLSFVSVRLGVLIGRRTAQETDKAEPCIEREAQLRDTIRSLEATVELKDAHISRLQLDTAPAITSAYATMREYANQMTEESRLLSEALNRAGRKLQAAPVQTLLSESRGILLSIAFLNDNLGKVMFPAKAPPLSADTLISFGRGFLNCMAALNSEIETRIRKAKRSLQQFLG